MKKSFYKSFEGFMNLQKGQKIAILTGLLLAILVGLPYLEHNQLTHWDAVGHYFNAEFYQENIFPQPAGWNPYSSGGFAQNYFYTPLFYWIVSALSFITPLAFSIKLIVLISIGLIPISVYYASKSFDLDDSQSAVAGLLMSFFLFWPNSWFQVGSIGLNLESTINGGLLSSVLAFPLFFIALAKMRQEIKNQPSHYWSPLLIAVTCLTHFIGFALVVFSIATIIKEPSWKRIKSQITIWIQTLFFTAFFIIPFVLFQNEKFSTAIFPIITPVFLSMLLVGFLLVAIQSLKEKTELEISFITLFLFGLLAVFLNVPVQLFRLIPIMVFLIMVMMAKFIPKKFSAIVIILAVLTTPFILPAIDWAGNQTIQFQIEPTPNMGRTVVSSNLGHEDYHLLRYELNRLGIETDKGLFVESSISSLFFSDFEIGINPDARIWGHGSNEYYYTQYDSNDLEKMLKKQQKVLGIRSILLDQNELMKEKGNYFAQQTIYRNNKKIMDKNYYYYITPEIELVELVTKAPLFSNVKEKEFFEESEKWFFDLNQIDRPLIQTIFKEWYLANDDQTVKLTQNNSKHFSIDINANHPVPVLIKKSYFSNWKAIQNGQEIPVYRAAPNWMIIYATGEVNFSFEKSIFETISLAFSVLFLLVYVAIGVLSHEKK